MKILFPEGGENEYDRFVGSFDSMVSFIGRSMQDRGLDADPHSLIVSVIASVTTNTLLEATNRFAAMTPGGVQEVDADRAMTCLYNAVRGVGEGVKGYIAASGGEDNPHNAFLFKRLLIMLLEAAD